MFNKHKKKTKIKDIKSENEIIQELKQENENLKYYIHNLELEKANLEGEIKTIERQTRREIYAYLEPIRNIFTNVDFKKKNKNLSYIETQLKNLLTEKNYEIFRPKKGTMHNKKTMIVADVVNTTQKSKDGLIEMVIACGIKQNDNIIMPARVRIYKGE